MNENERLSSESDNSKQDGDLNLIFEAIRGNQVLIGGQDNLWKQLDPFLAEDQENAEYRQKVLKKYQEVLKELRIRIGILLKMDNVSFLLGAGTSMDAGGVSLARIPFGVEQYLLEKGMADETPATWLILFYDILAALTNTKSCNPSQRKEIVSRIVGGQEPEKNDYLPSKNLEEFLTTLHTWQTALVGETMTVTIGKGQELSISRLDLSNLIIHLTEGLTKACLLPLKDKYDALLIHRRLLKKVLTRPLNLRRVKLFTLNYDTLLEQAADAEGIVLVDGFVGTLRRIFRPESFDQDFYFPAQTTEGRVHRLDRVLHLYKLHGSITWHREDPSWENPYGLYATFLNESIHHDDVLIYPTPLKYGQVLGLPYSELFRRLASSIVQPQSVLFVIGYGFGDEHVNTLIRQALSVPSFTLVIVDPDPQSAFVKQLEHKRDQRIWIVKGDGKNEQQQLWGLGTFKGFVEHLLPDLHEEEIQQRVIETYNALDPKRLANSPITEEVTDVE